MLRWVRREDGGRREGGGRREDGEGEEARLGANVNRRVGREQRGRMGWGGVG